MPHDLAWLNSLPAEAAAQELLHCCGSKRWAEQVAAGMPYLSLESLIARANEVWWSLDQSDWLEAFRSHPRIGEKKTAEQVSAQSQQWSGQEQTGMTNVSQQTADSLAALNQAYEEKFGYIFIICATGKTSEQMLSAVRDRLQHDPDAELPIAAAEQSQITELRLKKLLTSS
jgi:OHCU decarboxylase